MLGLRILGLAIPALICATVSANADGSPQEGLFINSIGNLDLQGVKIALKKGVVPKRMSGAGLLDFSALLGLANNPTDENYGKYKAIFQLLRSNGVPFDGSSAELGAAIKVGRPDLVRYLFEAGLDPHARMPSGYGAIEACIVEGKESLIPVFRARNVAEPTQSALQQLRLTRAIERDDLPGIRRAIEQGASPSNPDSSGRTPLGAILNHYRFSSNKSLVSVFIKEFRPDSGVPSVVVMPDQGALPLLHILALCVPAQSWEDVGSELFEYVTSNPKTKLDAKDSMGMTCLHWASRLGRVDLVKALISNGASTTLGDANGQTAMSQAKSPEVRQAFLETAPRTDLH